MKYLSSNWFARGFKNIWLPYTQMKTAPLPLAVKKTKNCNIILEDGRKLIDGISSWWSVCHGYNHPHIIKAITKQAKLMPHVMFAGLANKPAYNLAERLVKFVNQENDNHFTKVFYSDSGSTAVEVAMKISVQYFLNQGNKQKVKIISFKNAYHGDTMGGMSLCDPKEGMHAKFKNYLPKQLVTDLPKTKTDLSKFESFIKNNKDKAAAIIIEPLVQCAGGMKFYPAATLEKIIKTAQKNNILVILDECATGFYRTGTKFAYHQQKAKPDILVLGKALTGGSVTLAATLTTEKLFNNFLDDSLDKALMHGPTFMGNALSCAAANASLDLFEKYNYQKKSLDIENYLKEKLTPLKNHKNIAELRFLGAIAVIELKTVNFADILTLRKKLLDRNVWLRPFTNVIYIMPPLVIKKRELDKICKAIFDVV